MRYLRARFINYIGFYNGMNLTEVDIDFSKCSHQIVLIRGGNGKGKSTLLNHLNPFPDGSTSFIPERTAEKYLVLFNEGDTYEIRIISPADLKGRKTTKAYIRKNGIELNENGNVSSYKDIIFSEFELDSNYISLSRLSAVDRGIADKTPAERKKFVSNIIDDLEIYNSMYKTLNKKSIVYKANVNNLHTKIQNIGQKDVLENRLENLRNRESQLNSQIMDANNAIVSIQAKNSIDEEEARAIQDITNTANNLKRELDAIQIQLDLFYNKTKISKEEIQAKYTNDNELLSTYTNKLSEITTLWTDKSNRLKDVSGNILAIEAQISSIDAKDNISDRYSDSNNKIVLYREELSKLNIDESMFNEYSLSNLIDICDKLCMMIDNFYLELTPDIVKMMVIEYDTNNIPKLISDQNNIINTINSKREEISSIQGQMKILSTLENRPSKCKIDSCPFISDAVQLKKNLKVDLIESLNALQEEIISFSEECSEIQQKIDLLNSLVPKKTQLDAIRALFLENVTSITHFYPDYNDIDFMLSNMNTFGDLRDHKNISDGLNILKLLNVELDTNSSLHIQYDSYKEKIQLLNTTKSLYDKLKAEQIELTTEVSKLKSDIDSYKTTIDNLNTNIQNETQYAESYNKYLNKLAEYNTAQEKVNEYGKKSEKALAALSSINSYRDTIEKLSKELDPVMREISTLSGQLILLDSYYEEFNSCKANYDMLETLKKYCSPTGGGIQTLFMQMYMSKTKDDSNQILSMLFNGNYKLLDFVINENEFRIPFIGEGLPVDDISSGSSSQISMIGMIINLVLMHQGSSKFNIASLDEADAALDTFNRSMFVPILFHCLNILQIEQLFLISHSIEINDEFADIILLEEDNRESVNMHGNIIWSYYDNVSNQIEL